MSGPVPSVRLTSLPSKYYEFIGEIMFHWALHDAQLLDMLGALLKMGKQERRLLLGRMDEKSKASLVKFLTKRDMKPKDVLRRGIEKFCEIAQTLSDRRNQIAHAPWVRVVGFETPGILEMETTGKRYSPNAEIVTDEQIEDSISTFRMLTDLGSMILDQLGQVATELPK